MGKLIKYQKIQKVIQTGQSAQSSCDSAPEVSLAEGDSSAKALVVALKVVL